MLLLFCLTPGLLKYKGKGKIHSSEDIRTFAKGCGVFRPLTVTKTCRYRFSMQPVAFGTREVACSIVLRSSRAGVWCNLTIHWR